MPPLPAQLKLISPFLKEAADYDCRAPAIAYWCRVCAVNIAMENVEDKSKETLEYLDALLTWVEDFKKLHKDDEYVSNKRVAEANLKNNVIQVFSWARGEDQAKRWSKNVVKAFHTASILFQVLSQFTELDEEDVERMEYSQIQATSATSIHEYLEQPTASQAEAEEDLAESFDSMITFPPTPNTSLFVKAAQEENIENAKLFCKFAISALKHEDVECAVDNLQKALSLLQD